MRALETFEQTRIFGAMVAEKRRLNNSPDVSATRINFATNVAVDDCLRDRQASYKSQSESNRLIAS